MWRLQYVGYGDTVRWMQVRVHCTHRSNLYHTHQYPPMPTHTHPYPPVPHLLYPPYPTKKQVLNVPTHVGSPNFLFIPTESQIKYTYKLSPHNCLNTTCLSTHDLSRDNVSSDHNVHTQLLHTHLLLTQLVHTRGKAWQLVAAIALVCGLGRAPGDIQRQVWLFWTWTGWYLLWQAWGTWWHHPNVVRQAGHLVTSLVWDLWYQTAFVGSSRCSVFKFEPKDHKHPHKDAA